MLSVHHRLPPARRNSEAEIREDFILKIRSRHPLESLKIMKRPEGANHPSLEERSSSLPPLKKLNPLT
jgi:hypothetical protein